MVRHTQRKKSGKRTMKNLMSRMKWGGKRHRKRGGLSSNDDNDNMSTTPPMYPTDSEYPMSPINNESEYSQSLPMDSEYSQYPPVSMGGKRRKGHGRRSKKMKGGDGGADWVTKNFGTGQQQWDNTFGPASTSSGNLLPTLPGAVAVLANNIPQGSFSNAAPYAQAGGKGKKRKGKKGGSFMSMISTALVPLTLWGMQNKLTRKHKK